ncbi:type II toxin-antitoxin system RelE/ParE family toxin [Ningiella sp. W23]|uniref:type II toxin-antitoxin system RelE/ParE family toxin n=1 Tax=Ningiella sp. W23 TaxID=3023715 RepID=UPI0037573D60
MSRVVFADNAKSDLKEIVSYTKNKWGKTQAISYISALKKQTEILANMPTMGKLYDPYKTSGVHVFPFEKHLIYYIQNPKGITVIHVHHKAMEQSINVSPQGRT